MLLEEKPYIVDYRLNILTKDEDSFEKYFLS